MERTSREKGTPQPGKTQQYLWVSLAFDNPSEDIATQLSKVGKCTHHVSSYLPIWNEAIVLYGFLRANADINDSCERETSWPSKTG
jgi:hypothetical protein